MVQLIVKALLVVKGFTLTVGLNYFETFNPILKMTTIHILLSLHPRLINIFTVSIYETFS